jgi:hypothetical protein
MAQISKPPTARNQKRESVWLNEDPQQALDVWHAITAARWAALNGHTTTTGVHQDALDAALADETRPVLARLLRLAVDAAEADPLEWADPMAPLWSKWHIAVALRDEHHRLAPPARIVVEQDDRCRHDVRFTDPCSACDD